MRELVIAMALIEQGYEYILQLRGENPVIGGAGLIGCFGGKLEKKENSNAAVVRELREETTLEPEPSELISMGKVEVLSDYKLEVVRVFADVFRLVVSKDIVVGAREGEIVKLTKSTAKEHLDRMTTGTRACFEQFVLGEV